MAYPEQFSELESQGYVDVYSNVVGSGGNELDVTGKLEVGVMGASRVIPLLCEAKAYVDPVNMPTWQKFLGKLFLERIDKPTTMGILVALDGVNGNVRGSFESVQKKDDSILIFDGKLLLKRACEAGGIATEETAQGAVEAQFRRKAYRVEAAYYGGGYFWVAWWNDEEYSIVDAQGSRLPAQKVESLRDALAGSISGNLLATDDAQAQAEARHKIKTDLINRLLQVRMLSSTIPPPMTRRKRSRRWPKNHLLASKTKSLSSSRPTNSTQSASQDFSPACSRTPYP